MGDWIKAKQDLTSTCLADLMIMILNWNTTDGGCSAFIYV